MQTSLGIVIYRPTDGSSNSPYDRAWVITHGHFRLLRHVYGTIFYSTSSRHLPFESLKIVWRLIYFLVLFLNLYILFLKCLRGDFCHYWHLIHWYIGTRTLNGMHLLLHSKNVTMASRETTLIMTYRLNGPTWCIPMSYKAQTHHVHWKPADHSDQG